MTALDHKQLLIVLSRTLIAYTPSPLPFHPQTEILTLNGINVGDPNVPLPDEIFNMISDGEGASIIDSGTTYTMLRQEAFDALVKALREAIQLPQRRSPQWFALCFEDLDFAGADATFLLQGMLAKQTTCIEVETGTLVPCNYKVR
ncbi:hypothetical protein C1H46_034402 [Malus baccata]|uniref:Xylanase inhibitor C-terminal domain-containing protein n=1 Tax=Malus baccata TaxID=106549 RepID=A0A540L128_MALBA|nr:hypothetical protein C1H46_034402 [Malus baccata]